MTAKPRRRNRSTSPGPLASRAFFGAGGLVLGWAAFVWSHDNLMNWGLLGDSVAPATALLSVCALFAALWSVQLQSRELRLQRRELRESREAQQALAADTKRARQVAELANDIALVQNEIAIATLIASVPDQIYGGQLGMARYLAARAGAEILPQKAGPNILPDAFLALATRLDEIGARQKALDVETAATTE